MLTLLFRKCKRRTKNRLVLAITVLGMEVNFPPIVQLFTADYPTTLEKYFKEIGRAGCLGKPPTEGNFIS